MAASEALIERLRAKYTVADEFSTIRRPVNPDGFEAADHIEKLEADKARLNDALRQAVIDAAEWARKAGEAQGKLEISEAAGILDGWMRDCKRLEADNARLRAALEEFVASTGVSDDPDVLLVDALVYENAMRVLGLQK